jgi:endonuclease/exonuclease/phosphatase family metal-dependent hydrolase
VARILSFLSWNLENFHHDPARVDRVVDLVSEQDPDVFGLFEVKGAAVFEAMIEKMPGYAFTITESPGVPEILVGVRNGLTAFVTQKDELQSKVPTLRPGALTTIRKNGANYSLLFLHLKSFPGARDWGLRDDMFQHVASLKRRMERDLPPGEKANFLALGDINTMGLKPAYNDQSDLTGEQELGFVDNRMSARVNGMRRLPKTHHETWWNGKEKTAPAALDHVYAANHLRFTKFDNDAEVKVMGWVNEDTDRARREWIDSFSDHALLYGEIIG